MLTAINLLLSVIDRYDFSSFKSYHEQNEVDLAADFMPKIMFYSSSNNKQLIAMARETKSLDILEKAIAELQNPPK